MTLFRREFLQLIAGAAAASSIAFRAVAAQETARRVRVATGLLATWLKEAPHGMAPERRPASSKDAGST